MRNIFSAVLLVAIVLMLGLPSQVFAAKKLSDFQTPEKIIQLKEHVTSVNSVKEKNGKTIRLETVKLYNENSSTFSEFTKWTIIVSEGDMQFIEISYTEWFSDWPQIHFEYITVEGSEIKTKKGKPFYRVISLSDDEASEMEAKMKEKKSSSSLFAGF